jgi:NADP-reducing hydrogenase subunit HndB
MTKLTIDDLKAIKEKSCRENSLRNGPSTVKITVHMGTCGINAGARDVMNSLLEEMAGCGQDDIRVLNSGCIGMCSSEPIVTVDIQDEKPIVYQHMDAAKMKQVFEKHVLQGEVQTEFVLRK